MSQLQKHTKGKPNNQAKLVRPVGLDNSAAAAADTKYKCRISKICQKCYKQNFKNLFHSFLHIHTYITCAKFCENQRETVGAVVIWKSLTTHRHLHVTANHLYYKLGCLQPAELKTHRLHVLACNTDSINTSWCHRSSIGSSASTRWCPTVGSLSLSAATCADCWAELWWLLQLQFLVHHWWWLLHHLAVLWPTTGSAVADKLCTAP